MKGENEEAHTQDISREYFVPQNDPPMSAGIENGGSSDYASLSAENQASLCPRKCVKFQGWLASWVTSHRIPLVAVSELLRKLSTTFDVDFVIDARTLLNSPRYTSTRSVPPGEYCHFSLKENLERMIAVFLSGCRG